jgi:hypothetical protein
MEPTRSIANWLVDWQIQCPTTRGYECWAKSAVAMNVSGHHRRHWLKEKVNVCYGPHSFHSQLTGRWANSVPNNERLWVLGEDGGRYKGSVVTIEDIDWKKKSMFAMKPTRSIANWLVDWQIQCPTTRGYECWAKSAVAMNVSGHHRRHWLEEKVNVCYGTHLFHSQLTGRWANSVPNNERLWVLGEVNGRYEGSVVTIEDIDWKKKSMFSMEPTPSIANWLVVGEIQCGVYLGLPLNFPTV